MTLRDNINAIIARHIEVTPNGVRFDGANDAILAAIHDALTSDAAVDAATEGIRQRDGRRYPKGDLFYVRCAHRAITAALAAAGVKGQGDGN